MFIITRHDDPSCWPIHRAKPQGVSLSTERLTDSASQSSRPVLPPPHVLSSLVPDSPAFADLLRVEQQLDWTLLRKKAEINDALGKPLRVRGTIRKGSDLNIGEEITSGIFIKHRP